MTVGSLTEKARKNGPDQLRGLLLTLVIFGHTYAAGVSDDLGKWIIYGFHMPVFFAISGYLWRWDSLAGRTLPDLLGYFCRRMLWQWLLVSVLFNLYQNNRPTSPRTWFGLLFLEPTYHLWFIPALVLMVVATHVVIRAGCGWWTLAAMAVVGIALWELPSGKGMIPESLGDVDKRYFAYFVWFLLGFAIRNLAARVPPVWAGVPFAVAGMAVYVHSFGRGAWEHDIGFGLLNLGLILAVPYLFTALDRPLPLIGDAMITIGRGSLWVYLLHPFLTTYLEDYDDGGWSGRLLGLGITVAVVAVSTLLLKLTAARSARPGRHHPKLEAPVEAVPPDDVGDAVDLDRSGAPVVTDPPASTEDTTGRFPRRRARRADAGPPAPEPLATAPTLLDLEPEPPALGRHADPGARTVGPEVLDLPHRAVVRAPDGPSRRG